MNVKMMRGTIIRALVLVLVPVFAIAQTGETSWDNLQQLRAGAKIRVVDADMKTHEGTFLNYSPDAMSLRVATGDEGIRRESVVRVVSLERTTRLRNALIGAAVGGGAGLAVGGSLSAAIWDGNAPDVLALGLLVGAAVGAGAGSAFARYRTIYRKTQ